MARGRAELPGDMVPGWCVKGGGEGGRRGEEEGGCPSPRRGSRASSVLLFNSVGEGGRGGRGVLGPWLSFTPADTSGLANWTPVIRAAPSRAGARLRATQ